MFIDHHNRKIVTINCQTYSILILPIFSLSKPKSGRYRMVFDWGRGLAHPHAKIAFAILDGYSSKWIDRIIYENASYKIVEIKKCRSGRLAAIVEKMFEIDNHDSNIIKAVLEQEFQNTKNT